MGMKAQRGEREILSMLEEMSTVAKSAKRISEITEAMGNTAFQTTLLTLDAAVLGTRDLNRVGRTVKDASDDMHSQFDLLLEEVSELQRMIKAKRDAYLAESDLN